MLKLSIIAMILLLFSGIAISVGSIKGSSSTECFVSGYDFCFERTDQHQDQVSQAKIYWGWDDDGSGNALQQGYAVNRIGTKVGWRGDKVYFSDNINDVSTDVLCNDFGFCESSTGTLNLRTNSNPFTETFSGNVGSVWSKCLFYTVWDCSNNKCGLDNVGYWVWSRAGIGFSNKDSCPAFKIVRCFEDSDCSNNEICDKSGNWQDWKCEKQTLTQYWIIRNDECVSVYINPDDVTLDHYYSYDYCMLSLQQQQTKNYWRLVNNKCNKISLSPSMVTSNDYLTEQDCLNAIIIPPQKFTYYRFAGNVCSEVLLLLEEVTDNDYATMELCEANINGISGSAIIMIVLAIAGIFVYMVSRKKK